MNFAIHVMTCASLLCINNMNFSEPLSVQKLVRLKMADWVGTVLWLRTFFPHTGSFHRGSEDKKLAGVMSDTPGIPLRSWETRIFKISDNTKGYLFCTFNRQWWGFQRAMLLFKWITGPASALQWGLVGLSIPQDWGPGWGQYWRVLIIDKHWLETPERPREESFTEEVMEDTHVLKFRLSDIGRSALKREERQ